MTKFVRPKSAPSTSATITTPTAPVRGSDTTVRDPDNARRPREAAADGLATAAANGLATAAANGLATAAANGLTTAAPNAPSPVGMAGASTARPSTGTPSTPGVLPDIGPDILIRISAPRTRAPATSAVLDAAGVPNPPVPIRAGVAHVCATGSGPSPSVSVALVDVRASGAVTYDVAALNDVIHSWSSSMKPSGTRASDSRRPAGASCQRRPAAARALGTITSAARPQRGTLALEEKVKC